MTQDETLRMAREAGFSVRHIAEPPEPYDHIAGYGDVLERFAALVAAAEREACAKVCEDIDTEYEGEDVLATWCADAIRARGEK